MRRFTQDEKMAVPISPLIDVIFLLIIFFVVTTTLEKEVRDNAVKLAESSYLDPDAIIALTVVVNIARGPARETELPNASPSAPSAATSTIVCRYTP